MDSPARRVFVESPYHSDDPTMMEENIEYARRAMGDCLLRGEAPFLSHLLYTQHPKGGFVSDQDHEHQVVGRDAAINAASSWRNVADATVLYCDRGISRGMRFAESDAIKLSQTSQHRVIRRTINGYGLKIGEFARVWIDLPQPVDGRIRIDNLPGDVLWKFDTPADGLSILTKIQSDINDPYQPSQPFSNGLLVFDYKGAYLCREKNYERYLCLSADDGTTSHNLPRRALVGMLTEESLAYLKSVEVSVEEVVRALENPLVKVFNLTQDDAASYSQELKSFRETMQAFCRADDVGRFEK